jgi:large subunit ribosomal protein L21
MTNTEKKENTPAPKAEKTSGNLAVIKTGGKQYLVEEGQVVKIEKLPQSVINSDKVTFDEVLMTIEGGKVNLGTPTVSKKVTASIVEEGRDKKVSVIRYRSKSRYFKNKGHRQPFHKVKIEKIA